MLSGRENRRDYVNKRKPINQRFKKMPTILVGRCNQLKLMLEIRALKRMRFMKEVKMLKLLNKMLDKLLSM